MDGIWFPKILPLHKELLAADDSWGWGKINEAAFAPADDFIPMDVS